jgi:hypothetical protein
METADSYTRTKISEADWCVDLKVSEDSQIDEEAKTSATPMMRQQAHPKKKVAPTYKSICIAYQKS